MRALYLNADYSFLNLTTSFNLFVHSLEGKAIILKNYEGKFFRSQYLKIPVPSVGISATYVSTNKKKKRGIAVSKRNIMLRDGFKCSYCYKEVTHTTGNIDHIIPKSLGGATSFENCVCSCIDCNTRKGNLSPSEALVAGFRLQFKPRQISNEERLEILIKSVTKTERKNFLDFLEENNLKLF
jgi:hypothetical protein